MIKYFDGQITDILPRNLTQEPAAQAFSAAVREGTRLLNRYTQLCYVYCSIDTAPNNVVDLLAKELRTQYYQSTLDLATKRWLVKNTLIWYMSAGTPEAVEELVKAVFGEGEVQEWFEYGGVPYTFRIISNTILTPEIDKFFNQMIQRVKNTRSHLESVKIVRRLEQEICTGVVCSGYSKSVIL